MSITESDRRPVLPLAERASDLTSRNGQVYSDQNTRAQAIAWISILSGALLGMVMGLWSFNGPFNVPSWIGEYNELPRRFLRLAHAAMFALGILHIMIAKRISTTDMHPRIRTITYNAMAVGNVLMPTALIGAAFWEPVKFLTTVPATALTIAFALIAYDAIRSTKRIEQ
mgnify:CR=1 FL=1